MHNEYFTWLSDLVCRNRFSNYISYKKLLTLLHETEFRYSILKDGNRAEDGVYLRYRFANYLGLDHHIIESYLEGPCSVLEMMIALSIRCEEETMDNPQIGDRTSQWFWEMVTNLGLGSMNDKHFDEDYCKDVIERFLDREYEPTGKGGLFTVRNCDYDLRGVEIWHQLCWYLDNIT